MAIQTLTLRRATAADLSAVDRLLIRSYARLLAHDYPPSTLALALPRFARARPELLASRSYFVAEDAQGRILGAGGWSRLGPSGGPVDETAAHVRHVATDPDAAREGVGRAVMELVMQTARTAGMRRLDCLSTRTAEPFYRRLGFQSLHPAEISLGAGIGFAVIRMRADLRPPEGPAFRN